MTKPRIHLLNRGLSKSFLSTWLQCRESARIQYFEGFRPHPYREPLMFGSAFHDINSQLLKPRITSPQIALQCANFNTKYLSEHRKKMDRKQKDTFVKVMSEIHPIMQGYCNRYALDRKRVKWIEREKWFSMDINVDFEDFTFIISIVGLRDGMFQYMKKGKASKPWLFESKTKMHWNEDDTRAILRYDLQTMLYCWTWYQQHGSLPQGICYDVVRRPSLKLSTVDGDLDAHEERVLDDIASRPNHYFQRFHQNVLRKSDLEDWYEYYFINLLRNFIQWCLGFYPDWHQYISKCGDQVPPLEYPFDNPFHFANAEALVTPWGRSDMFDAITTGDYSELVKSPSKPMSITLKQEV